MQSIASIISEEEKKLDTNSNPSHRINILFNLVILKNKSGLKQDNYKDFKKFIEHYIEVVKLSDYGYDKLNHNKIEKLLSFLNYEEQISALNYAISVSARELPEHDKDWFIQRKHKAEIAHIFKSKNFDQYLRGCMLYCGTSLNRLLLMVVGFFTLVVITLLPAVNKDYVLFNVSYENYSQSFFLNHLLNILTHLADVDNNFKVDPINWFGVLLLVLGKVLFIFIVVNFVYRKISDKLNIK